MYFKVLLLSNFVSIISILDTFTWYFILQMITWALESKEEIKNEKDGLDAMALAEFNKLAVASMPQHWAHNAMESEMEEN